MRAAAGGLSIFDAARKSPSVPALIANERSYSHAELADRTREAVAWLRTRSLAGAGPVGLVARPDVSSLVMLHALIATGTPALLLHPRLTAPERESLRERVAAAWPEGDGGEVVVVPPDWRKSAPPGAGDEFPRQPDDPDPDDPLAIVFTSGTTGRPRGVVLSRRAFMASAAASAANLGWEDDDRWLLPLPVAHVGGLSIVTRCLLARRTVVLADGADASAILDRIERDRVTLVSLVPTLLSRILDVAPAPPSRLRAVLLGGAGASPALLARAADRGWPVLTTYGLTEACSQVTTQPYGTVNRGELGAGPPLPGAGIRIGTDDEIQVRGPMLFDGYLEDPAASGALGATSDRSATEHGDRPLPTGGRGLDRPFLDGGWFSTRDRGRLDDNGNLHVLGRRVDRIVTGGENVDPMEVEQTLEALPGIREVCVVGIPDDEWGEMVGAALVVEAGFDIDPVDVADNLRQRLAPFKVPRRLVVVERLPRNPMGKLDRHAVARRLAAGG